MSFTKSIWALRYASKHTIPGDCLHKKLDEYQSTLENLGFKVKRDEQMINYDVARVLTAEKDNVVLRISRYLRGGEDISMILKRDGYEKIVSLLPFNFKDALAIANTASAYDKTVMSCHRHKGYDLNNNIKEKP